MKVFGSDLWLVSSTPRKNSGSGRLLAINLIVYTSYMHSSSTARVRGWSLLSSVELTRERREVAAHQRFGLLVPSGPHCAVHDVSRNLFLFQRMYVCVCVWVCATKCYTRRVTRFVMRVDITFLFDFLLYRDTIRRFCTRGRYWKCNKYTDSD